MPERGWFRHRLEADDPWSYFGTVDDAYHGRRIAEIVAAADLYLPRNGLVLDVGIGSGVISQKLAELGHRPVGIDHVALADLATPTTVADAAALPIRSGTVDMVLLCEIIYYFDDETAQRIIDECRRVLAPSGHLFITQRRAWRQPDRSPEDLGIEPVECSGDWWTLGRVERMAKMPVYVVGSSRRVQSALDRAPAPIRSLATAALRLWCSRPVDASIAALGRASRRIAPEALLRSTRNIMVGPMHSTERPRSSAGVQSAE